MNRPQVYISYSRNDREADQALSKLLESLDRAGFSPFVDRTSLKAGDDWSKTLQDGLQASEAAVIILSKSALSSDYIFKEVSDLLDRKDRDPDLPIVPLPAGDLPLQEIATSPLKKLTEFVIPQADTLDERIEQVLAALEPLRQRIAAAEGGPIASRVLASHAAPILDLAVGQINGRRLVVAAGQDARIVFHDLTGADPAREPLVIQEGKSATCISLGELQGRTVVLSGWEDGALRIFDLEPGQREGSSAVPTPEMPSPAAALTAALITGVDGRPLLIASRVDGRVSRWDAQDGRLLEPSGGSGPLIADLALAAAGGRQWLVMASGDGNIYRQDLGAWDRDAEPITGHHAGVTTVATGHLDGKAIIVSGSQDSTIRVWDLLSGRLLGEPLTGHTGPVLAVALAELRGRNLLASAGVDRSVRLWDLAKGESLASPLEGHTGQVNALAWTELDGQPVIVSASDDHTLRLWPLPDTLLPGELRDQVEWLSDTPAHKDLLNRKPLAKALAERLRRIHAEGPDSSFLVHVDGPWGSGKTTLLNFLQDDLEPDWMVVTFNAWRQARVGPTWWALLAALRKQYVRQFSRSERLGLRIAEFWFRIRLAGASYLLALVLLALFSGGIYFILRTGALSAAALTEAAKTVSAVVAALGTLWVGARVASKFLLWDSARGAHFFEQSNQDPMQSVADLFGWMIKRVSRPVVFFIDDLDRCEEGYVVDLLEAVQTLMRDVLQTPQGDPASRLGPHFVVAADGAWIRNSFAKKYASFTSYVSEPGKPLGYLFLDKLFQLNVQMPTLSPRAKSGYLGELLRTQIDQPQQEELAEEEQAVRQRIAVSSTEGPVIQALKQASPVVRERLAPLAVDKFTQREVVAATEHALQKFAPLLEPNPRAMKRFLNAYSVQRAVQTLQGNLVERDALALWTILRTRWPGWADYLQANPEAVDAVGKTSTLPPGASQEIKDLFSSEELEKLVKFSPGSRLTADLIRACSGMEQPR